MELKKQVVAGFIWSATEKFGSLFIQFCVHVLLTRLLDPALFGFMAILTALCAISSSIIDSGFSQALIHKQNANNRDYNSVFYLNLAVSILLYGGLLLISYPLAEFYGTPELTDIAPLLFCILPINALSIIQITILTKRMDFKKISKTNLAASAVSGTVAVVMAFAGYGIWALVVNLITLYVVRSVMLWLQSDWRPSPQFSIESIRQLFGLGSRLFAAGLITQIFNNFAQLILGKVAGFTQLGYYERALKYKELLSSSVSLPVQNVTFPAFATLQNDEVKLKLAARKAIAMLSLVLFPCMAGLIAVADEAFAVAFGAKMMPAVPYFRVLCLSILCMPLANISLNIMKAKGRGNMILSLEIVKKAFALVVILYACSISVMAVAWAYFAWMVFEMIANLFCVRRIIPYSFVEQLRDTLPYLVLSAAMYCAVVGAGYMVGDGNALILLTVKICAGIVVYIGLAWLFKPAAWNESLVILNGLRQKLRPAAKNRP